MMFRVIVGGTVARIGARKRKTRSSGSAPTFSAFAIFSAVSPMYAIVK